MKKLRSSQGETLIETLTAVLIVVLCLSFLATAIVAAARLNAAVRDADVSLRYDDGGSTQQAVLTVTPGRSGTSFQVPVEIHTTDNGYCRYTYDGN